MRGRRGRVLVAAVGGLGVACLVMASVEAVTWGPPDPLAGLTAPQVLGEANANFTAAQSLTMDGEVSDSGGTYHLDLGVVPARGCRGTVGYRTKGSVDFVQTGLTAYLRPDGTWWTASAGSDGKGVSQLLDDRYLEEADLSDGRMLTPWCDELHVTNSDVAWGTLTKGKITSFHGTRELALDGAHGQVMYVTDTSKPQITGFLEPKARGNGDSAEFDVSVGTRVTLEVPSSRHAVDAADFGFTDGLNGTVPLEDVGGSMVDSVFANLHAAHSVTITGSQVDSGSVFSLDMGFKARQGCAGTIGFGDNRTIKLVVSGQTVYFNPDDQYWLNDADATGASEIISAQGGRYIKAPLSDSNLQAIAQVCAIPASIGQSTPLGTSTAVKVTPAGLIVGEATTIDGVTAVPISDGEGDVVYVSDAGRLEIVKDSARGGSYSGSYTFRVNAPVALTAPPPSDVIAASALGI
ncbi:MAG TPA: hypothetical protein VHT26_17250 [Trebonia sp.]|nr:hypothetical protein [Trebonia sp.]